MKRTRNQRLRDNNRKRLKAVVDEARDEPCTDCKRFYPYYVMEFDHVRGKKIKNVSSCNFNSKKQLLKEMAKCDLVCANCHRVRTHTRRRK